MRSVISRIILILIAVAVAAGCRSAGGAGGERVVAGFYPLAYAAERVAPPTARIEDLTPTGAEPHDLELTPRAAADIERADVVLYLGRGFQPAVADAVHNARGRAVDVLAGLPLHPASGEPGLSVDPHVWLDPVRFEHVVLRIGAVLKQPVRAATLVSALSKLDAEYRAGLAHCARRDIVTSHAAFGYLAQRYGLRQLSVTGLTPETEPTAKQLLRVIRLVRKTHATTVFFERLVSPRLADTVAREVGAKTAVLDPVEGLTPSEEMRGDTYFTLMRQNLAALRKALGCR